MDERRFICSDCGTPSPDTSGENSALISLKYGWRLRRRLGEDGTAAVEARCPRCESRRKNTIRPPGKLG